MVRMPKGFWLIAPYAAWMALMAVLPATATAYAIRTIATAGMLWWALRGNLWELLLGVPSRNTAVSPRSDFRSRSLFAAEFISSHDSVDAVVFVEREHRGGDGVGGAGSGWGAQSWDRSGGECHHASPDTGEIPQMLRLISGQE